MKRARTPLTLARATARPQRPPLSMVKKAIRLFKGQDVPRALYRANALKWLAANARLGDNHLLRGGTPKWGRPGEPRVAQVFAPRRLGARS